MFQDVICISSDDDYPLSKQQQNQEVTDESKKPDTTKGNGIKRKATTNEIDTLVPFKRIHPIPISRCRFILSDESSGEKSDAVLSKSDSKSALNLLACLNSHEKLAKKNSFSTLSSSECGQKTGQDDVLNQPSTSKDPQFNVCTDRKMNDSDISEEKTESIKMSKAPQLIIKEKRPAENNHDGSEVFSQFLSLCLSKDRTPSMQKIVERLKRHYERMDQDFARSSEFITMLNEKRDLLMSDNKLYVHILNIDEEIRCRRMISGRREGTREVSLSDEGEQENGDEIDNTVDKKRVKRIKIVVEAMEKCQKRIKQLEDQEVDWEEENDSNYIKLSRYKEKMIQLYYKYCELTGEHEDAGRPYLRPKYLKVTKIESVDQAIVSFINKKLTDKIKRQRKGLSAADCVIFPDYVDILSCIQKCNEERDMGMTKSQIEKLAKKAFEDLGNNLQRVRQQDLLDTMELIIEKSQLPEPRDPELIRTLNNNKVEAKKKMDAIFEEFSRRQEDRKFHPKEAESETEENDDDDEENDEVDEKFNNKDVDDINLALNENDDGEVSDSAETIILPGIPEPQQMAHRVVDSLGIGNTSKSDDQHESPIILANLLIHDVQGMISLNKKDIEDRNRSENSQRSEPDFTKKTTKPMITEIRPVKVVIKAHDIVKINKVDEKKPQKDNIEISDSRSVTIDATENPQKTLQNNAKCEKLTGAAESSDICKTETLSNCGDNKDKKEETCKNSYQDINFKACEGNTQSPSNNTESDIEIVEEINKPQILIKECESIDSKVQKLDNNGIVRSGEKSLTLNKKNCQDLTQLEKNDLSFALNSTKTSMINILSNEVNDKKALNVIGAKINNDCTTTNIKFTVEEITSSTESNSRERSMGKSINGQSELVDIADVTKTVMSSYNDLPLPDSTLRDTNSPENTTGDNTNELENQTVASKPILKVRSFAKPPDFWQSPTNEARHKQITENKNKNVGRKETIQSDRSTIEKNLSPAKLPLLTNPVGRIALLSGVQPKAGSKTFNSQRRVSLPAQVFKKLPVVISDSTKIIRPMVKNSQSNTILSQINKQHQNDTRNVSSNRGSNGESRRKANVCVNPLNRVVRQTTSTTRRIVNHMSVSRKQQ